MLCQLSATYCLGDDPTRSVPHECRFPTIIQLDEVAPPPPSSQKATLSPVPSSSQSYDYYSSSEEGEVEDEEDEEEATESYCSSDPSHPGFCVGNPELEPAATLAPAEQKTKMNRVLAWRNSFDSVFAEDNAGMFLSTSFVTLATRHIFIFGGFDSVRVPTEPLRSAWSLVVLARVPAFELVFLTQPSVSSSVDVTEAEILE